MVGRKGSCSAAGWFIEAVVLRGNVQHIFPLKMAGKYLNSPISSFTAEMIAVDEAIDFIYKLIFNF